MCKMVIALEKNIHSIEEFAFWGIHIDNIQDPTKIWLVSNKPERTENKINLFM